MDLLRSICVVSLSMTIAFVARADARDVEMQSAAPLAQRFVALAGNEDNALALALSLRNGERVVLVHDDGGSNVPATTVFALPSRAMGWDEVAICLALVEDTLVRQGVRRPTPEQLESALTSVLQTLDPRVRVRGKGS